MANQCNHFLCLALCRFIGDTSSAQILWLLLLLLQPMGFHGEEARLPTQQWATKALYQEFRTVRREFAFAIVT